MRKTGEAIRRKSESPCQERVSKRKGDGEKKATVDEVNNNEEGEQKRIEEEEERKW